MRNILITTVVLSIVALSGCKKASQPNSAEKEDNKSESKLPADKAAAEAEKNTSTELEKEGKSEDQPAAPVDDKEKLAKVFHQVWCLNQRQDREGLKAVLGKAGFKDAAAWSAAWAKATKSDPKWFEQVMSDVVSKPCLLPNKDENASN